MVNDTPYTRGHGLKMVNVPSKEDLIDMIDVKISDLLLQISRLENENKKLKDDAYKDKELSELKDKYDSLKSKTRHGFFMTDDEEEQVRNIKQLYNINTGLQFGSIGGGWEYRFRPTSIGISIVLVDPSNNEHIIRELT